MIFRVYFEQENQEVYEIEAQTQGEANKIAVQKFGHIVRRILK
jgi:hypothetical protein